MAKVMIQHTPPILVLLPSGCLADVDGYSSTDYYFREKSNYTAELRVLSNDRTRTFLMVQPLGLRAFISKRITKT